MNKKFFTYLNFIIITLISYESVTLVYSSIEKRAELSIINSKLSSYNRPHNVDGSLNKPLQIAEYDAISKRNLFNISEKASNDNRSYDFSNLKKSSGNLKLWGTITGLGKGNIAIIEDTTKRKQDLYHVDDVVQNSKIVNILRNKVIISVNGNEEILEVSDSIGNISPVRLKRRITSKKKAIKRVFRIKKSLLENALGNVSRLSKEIKVRPYYKNGEPSGIRIRRISRISVFRRIGLRTGDVIKSVQGIEIKSMNDSVDIINSLNSANRINVSVERLGRLFNFEYNVDNR